MSEKVYLGENSLSHLWLLIKNKLGTKVDKIDGKGLSTNDYTTEEKNKLAGLDGHAHSNKTELDKIDTNKITNWDTGYTHSQASHAPSNAQANVIESVKVNGSALSVAGKAVNITVPTNNNELTNGAGYQTSNDVQAAINNALSGITGIDFQVVTELPTTGVKGTIYLISNNGTAPNIYDEYIWVNDKFEKIGTTAVDLSGYLKKTDMVEMTNDEIDTICV